MVVGIILNFLSLALGMLFAFCFAGTPWRPVAIRFSGSTPGTPPNGLHSPSQGG